MSDLVRNHVGLREFARRPESLLQLVEKPEVQVNLFVLRAVKWPRRGLRFAAAGACLIAKQYQLGMAVTLTRLRKQPLPRRLNIVQDEFYELYLLLFPGVAGGIGGTMNYGGRTGVSRYAIK